MSPRVQPIEGEPFRYHVLGITGTYLVDLKENAGIGWCGCQDFEKRRQRFAETLKVRPENDEHYWCKHLHLVWEEVGKDRLRKEIDEELRKELLRSQGDE